MSRITVLFLLALTYAGPSPANVHRTESNLRVLMTVGGVGYNTWIVRMLQGNPGIELELRSVDDDGIVFTGDALANADAVLMYHRDNIAEVEEREALLRFLDGDGGIVVLHHAIANYPDWPAWWRDHVGGLYVLPGHADLPPSRYFPDFKGVARPARDHPVTQRLGAFWRYADESYERLWISDDVDVLLTTTAFGSDDKLAWIGPSKSRRVIFIQPGHGDDVLTDPKYLSFVEDALRWTSRDID